MNNGIRQDAAASQKTFREKLHDVITTLPADTVTLSDVLDQIGYEGFLLFAIFLTLPFMVPVSIPGVSTVFGAVILLIGFSVMFNRHPWLPSQLMKRQFPAPKLRAALEKGSLWLQRVERISHPRLLQFNQGTFMPRFNGFMIVLGALLLMVPLSFVPFSNTLPGLAVLFLAIGILQQDGGCLILGYLANLVTMIYFGALAFVGKVAVEEIIRRFFPWLL